MDYQHSSDGRRVNNYIKKHYSDLFGKSNDPDKNLTNTCRWIVLNPTTHDHHCHFEINGKPYFPDSTTDIEYGEDKVIRLYCWKGRTEWMNNPDLVLKPHSYFKALEKSGSKGRSYHNAEGRTIMKAHRYSSRINLPFLTEHEDSSSFMEVATEPLPYLETICIFEPRKEPYLSIYDPNLQLERLTVVNLYASTLEFIKARKLKYLEVSTQHEIEAKPSPTYTKLRIPELRCNYVRLEELIHIVDPEHITTLGLDAVGKERDIDWSKFTSLSCLKVHSCTNLETLRSILRKVKVEEFHFGNSDEIEFKDFYLELRDLLPDLRVLGLEYLDMTSLDPTVPYLEGLERLHIKTNSDEIKVPERQRDLEAQIDMPEVVEVTNNFSQAFNGEEYSFDNELQRISIDRQGHTIFTRQVFGLKGYGNLNRSSSKYSPILHSFLAKTRAKSARKVVR
uniref:Uncharacterized protein n=1 Tax=viral metagenome TaxID=1070528 RepID=A0A6C0JTG3_9ZZZZ